MSRTAKIIVGVLIALVLIISSYIAGHVAGREEGYIVGRNSLIEYMDTAEAHIEERILELEAHGQHHDKKWQEKVVAQCGHRRDLVVRGNPKN